MRASCAGSVRRLRCASPTVSRLALRRHRAVTAAYSVAVSRFSICRSYGTSIPTTTDHAISWTGLTGHLGRELPLPPPTARGNPAAWASLIEPYLPSELKSSHPRWPLHAEIIEPFEEDLPGIVLEAKKQANIDIMAHFALDEGRWDVMQWISNVILWQSKVPDNSINEKAVLQSVEWPRTSLLDDMTADARSLRAIGPSHRLQTSATTLENFTNAPYSTVHVASWPRSQRHLGLIWETTACLLIRASEETARKSALIMPHALRLVGQLHHEGYIPQKVYGAPPPDGPVGIHQPQLISELSNSIMSALFDAANYADPNQSSLFGPFDASGARVRLDIGPELWMEFVLWCCVHGGWLLEGTAILDQLRRRPRKRAWRLVCWRDLQDNPAEGDPQTSSADRTVSSEVVVALVDGLVAALNTEALQSMSLRTVTERLLVLKKLLERDKMSLGTASWDEVVARLVGMPQLDVLEEPRTVEAILELAEQQVIELRPANVQGIRAPLSLRSYSDYIFDGTTAILGLHHRTLHAYANRHDVDGALRVLAHLQHLTDINKQQAMKDFFYKLKLSKTKTSLEVHNARAPTTALITAREPGHRALFPLIPSATLAPLLDLVMETDQLEVGQWMIHSTDIDGPLIGEELYGDRTIAPSILRFAVQMDDTDLLSRIMQRHSAGFDGYMMLTACEARLKQGDLQGAERMLQMMGEQAMHMWTEVDIAVVVRAVLPSIGSDADDTKCQEAKMFLKAFLRDDHKQFESSTLAALDGVIGVVSTASERLVNLCSEAFSGPVESRIRISRRAFDAILQGAVEAFGSSAGQGLWETWCDSERPVRKTSIVAGQSREGQRPGDVAKQFSADGLKAPKEVTFTGFVPPRVSALRTIVHQATAEIKRAGGIEKGPGTRSSTEEQQAVLAQEKAYAVLEWAEGKFMHDLQMSPEEVEAELHESYPWADRGNMERSQASTDQEGGDRVPVLAGLRSSLS